MQPHFI